MSATLSSNSYGKSSVRLTKVTRKAEVHELKELTVDIELQGAFDRSYTHGDNSSIVATDTMKNTVYALARNHPLPDIESFGQSLAKHFLDNNPHITAAEVHISEHPWQRIQVDGKPHPTAFVGGGSESRTAVVRIDRLKKGSDPFSLTIRSGLAGLLVLKTTDSAFIGFLRDEFTTRNQTDDRIFATSVTADWSYSSDTVDFDKSFEKIRTTMLEVFATHKSLAVQQTLHDMGQAALDVCKDITEISLTMPNQHRLLMNLAPFGMANPNEIFVPTSEPYGLIKGTLRRK